MNSLFSFLQNKKEDKQSYHINNHYLQPKGNGGAGRSGIGPKREAFFSSSHYNGPQEIWGILETSFYLNCEIYSYCKNVCIKINKKKF